MQNIVAFIGEIPTPEEQAWISQISLGLSNVCVIPFHQLSLEQKSKVEVAIVAIPNLQELKELPQLCWVQSLWAGVERLLAESVQQSFGIVRMEDPKMAFTMAEAVLAWTLYLHRDMPKYLQQQKIKQWQQNPLIEISERRIGVLGLGNIGKTCVERLVSNGFSVKAWSRRAKSISGVECLYGTDGLINMLNQSDILICLLPLTDKTQGLLNEENLKQLPLGASLINFARGAIVEELSLLTLLQKGHINHAVLDVFDREPLPKTSQLWANKNITILPHISAPTNKRTASKIVATNIMCYLNTGKTPKLVNRSQGY